MTEDPRCIIHDFDLDYIDHIGGEAREAWFRKIAVDAMVSSQTVVDRAESIVPWFGQPGIYFLVKDGKVVYVGQSGSISFRIKQHLETKGRFDAISVLLGIPKWAQTVIEYASTLGLGVQPGTKI
ncbi:MAG TPA: hypothetical protein VM621_10640 [Luteibacter sp.]|uniref:hypothetical protein n=1 Tax=Luteibacter sp. TaxID=1886636 RepID=UPI002C7304D8|nr:hypothetical protein [Luteibacter sp.]HVI55493.1 hypothetical protein [Luteibacter sp.]